MFKVYLFLFIVGTLSAVGYGAYYEYKDMQTRIETLRENNTKLKMVAEDNQRAMEEAQAFAEEMTARNQELQSNLQKAEAYKDELQGKLQRHDLSRLSLQKPGLIEKRINDATKRLWNEMEELTGSTASPSSD
jgi:DNA-binding protein H-NS